MNSTIHEYTGRSPQIGTVERAVSLVAGGYLVGLGLLRSSRNRRAPLLLAGTALISRGLSGYSLIYSLLDIYRGTTYLKKSIRVEQSVVIGQPVDDVFAFWMALENLPSFMEHLEMVAVRDDGTSHWVATAPFGRKVEWDARITRLEPGSLVAWESLPGSMINNAGEVRFSPVAGDESATLTHVILEYKAPGGSMGAALARLMGEEPEVQLRKDLLRLQAILEPEQVRALI